MYEDLPFIEFACYFVCYVGIIFTILYRAYEASQANQHMNPWLIDGWAFTGSKKDVSDVLLEMLDDIFLYAAFFAFIHYILAEIVKSYNNKILPYFYVLFSMIVLGTKFTYKTVIVLAVQTLLNLLITYHGNTLSLWIYSITGLILISSGYLHIVLKWYHIENYAVQYIYIISLWNILRHVSFSIDKAKHKSSRNLVQGLGYVFYFPALCGPLLLYEDFDKVYHRKYSNFSYKRLTSTTVTVFKYVIYLYLTSFMRHFIHQGLVHQMPNVQLSYAASSGLFLWTSLQFMMVYIVLYGFGIVFAHADGIVVPVQPRCVLSIAEYSEMWQFFDEGLYRFVKKYIYIAYMKANRSCSSRLMAGILTFVFTFVWHGVNWKIFVWCLLNYAEFILESSILNKNKQRHIVALITSLLLGLSLISQHYLFGTYESAVYQTQQILQVSVWQFAFYFLFTYTFSQTIIQIKMKTRLLENKCK